jgi:GT2 family glycosyltransferase/glycosyltransferase involved in cell wall biosynthesis
VSSVVHVSVVIPVYNARQLAENCVASIFGAHTNLTFEVIVVDNGSGPDVEEWLRSSQVRHAALRYLRYPHPLGFARAVNAGVSASLGQIVIVLNSDTLVSPGWMDGLYEALVVDESLGAVTPVTNNTGEAAQIDLRTADLTPVRALKLVAAKPREPGVIIVAHRLTFFCVALRRSVWDEMGGLDESYAMGNYEDDHLCLRLRLAGYRLGIAPNVFVYHYSNATFRANGVPHHDFMRQNAATFAAHARAFAAATPPPQPRASRPSADDVSVVILDGSSAALDKTLVSLENQTVTGFEIVRGSDTKATRAWIAYVSAGDICYPFHLEALKEALNRTASVAVFADPWITDPAGHTAHPDATRIFQGISIDESPRPHLLAGWMHHASLDPDRMWEETLPVHLPRMTWERGAGSPGAPAIAPPPVPSESGRPMSARAAAIDMMRSMYRRAVPYETRLEVDRRIRGWLRPETSRDRLSTRAHDLSVDRHPSRATHEPGRFAIRTPKPTVFLFSIIAWHWLTQRPQQFARGLAQRGHTVFWVETRLHPPSNWSAGRRLLELVPGVHQLLLPGTASYVYQQAWDRDSVQAMSTALAEVASAYGVGDAVSLVNFPRWEPVVADVRARLGWNIVYDCLDDQPAFADLFQTDLADHEQRLIRTASAVTTSGFLLRDRLQRSRDVVLLPNGVDFELFSSQTPNHPLSALSRPVVGFFGAFADWLDTDLIRAAAIRFPDWSFVYIGGETFSSPRARKRWADATSLANVVVVPNLSPSTLVTYLSDFDVCTMPFLDVPVTRAMNAVKLYEYLAGGKRVVCRDLPEVRRMVAGDGEAIPGAGDLIALYTTETEFFDQLEAAVAASDDGSEAARRRFAQDNDWASRVDRLSAEIVRAAGADDHDTSSSSAASIGRNT